jgi:PIN domain nuclease of toxin-antitoxin system
MIGYVTDTHALLWHISKDSRLSNIAKAVFDKADIGKETIVVPSIVLVECVYLAEKKRIERKRVDEILAKISQKQYPYKLAQIDADTIYAMEKVDRNKVPDMPDRIITAIALQLSLPLISKDGKIRNIDGLDIIW